MASHFALELLGPPRLLRDGRPVQLLRRKATALLAYLAMEGRSQSREAMAALFWPDCDQARARANLRRCLFSLRPLSTGGGLSVEGEMLRVPPGSVVTDVEEFRRLARGCGRHDVQDSCDDCLRLLQEAASCYKGDLLAGFTLADCIEFDRWQNWRGLQLRAETASVLRRLITGHRRRDRFAEAIGCAQRLLSLDPMEEAAHQELMRLYASSGQWTMALRQYRECCRTLREELDVGPDKTTIGLYEAVCARRLAEEPARRGPPEERRSRLPLPPTALIGRESELSLAHSLLGRREAALVTLTGAGGAGKTRLALEIAAQHAAEFEDGAFFVDLAPLHECSQIVPAIGQAIGVRGQQHRGTTETVTGYLAGRRILLLLDNFEHLAAGAPQVAEILAACPRLAVLVTSRQPLRIRGEMEIPVSPLALPDPDQGGDPELISRVPAVRLFVERTIEARPDFVLNAGNARLVAEACRRLDGLPLAIELAAPHLKALSLQDLVDRLASPLALLRSGARDLPPRQQALRSTLDWSYGLLSAGDRRLLAGVSVFRGGFGLGAAEEVCCETWSTGPEAILDGLESLTDKSLLRQAQDGGSTRFRLLETIREFAAERLVESREAEATRARHAGFYVRFAETAAGELHGPDQVDWLQRLERDHDNLLAAARWLLEKGHGVEALREAVALEWFWFTRAYAVRGQRCTEEALAAAGENTDPGLRARGLYTLGRMVFLRGDWARAIALSAESADLFRRLGDDAGLALALSFQGVAERFHGDDETGTRHCDRAMAIVQRIDDPWLLVLTFIRAYATVGGRLAGATPRARLEQAVEISRRRGDLWAVAHSLNGLGDLLREQGAYDEAQERYAEALKGFRALDDEWMVAWTQEGLGRTWSLAGNHGRAGEQLAEAIRRFHRLGDRGNTVFMLQRLAMDAGAAGDHARAAALLGAFSSLGAPSSPADTAVEAAVTEYAARYPREWALGQAMNLAEAVDYALREPAGCL